MGRYLSDDLRVRVIRAIDGCLSRRAAADRYGVSVSRAIRWMSDCLAEGRCCAKPQGGDQRSGRIEAQAEFLMDTIDAAPDITPAERRERLIEERGEAFALSTIHGFFDRHGVSYKKGPRRPANRSAKT